MPILHLGDGAGIRWPAILHAAPLMVIYKHSPFCSASLFSRSSVRAFSLTHPEIPIFQVDVIRHRSFSARIGRDLGVGHASPQVIMVAHGQPVWTGAHGDVSAAALCRALASRQLSGSPPCPGPAVDGVAHAR